MVRWRMKVVSQIAVLEMNGQIVVLEVIRYLGHVEKCTVM